jgi:hypothetical protein
VKVNYLNGLFVILSKASINNIYKIHVTNVVTKYAIMTHPYKCSTSRQIVNIT